MSNPYSIENPTSPLTNFASQNPAIPACVSGPSGFTLESPNDVFCAPYSIENPVVPECPVAAGSGGSPVMTNLILWLEANSGITTQNLRFSGKVI